MRALPLAALVGLILATAPATAATRPFPVAGFDRVRSTVPYDVQVRTGRAAGVVATGDARVLDRLDVRVVGGELVIGSRRSRVENQPPTERVTIEVAAPMVHGLTLEGPGNLDVDRLRNGDMALTLRGPGNLRVAALEAMTVAVTATGPGNVEVGGGRARRADIVASGPGNVHLGGLGVRDVRVTLSGPGDVDATASGTADLTLNGPGDIRIAGTPRCRVVKRGPGNVRCG